MSAGHAAMPAMAEHMRSKGFMEQMQTMSKDHAMMKDRAMQHDMDDMQGNVAAMAKDMDKTLQTMEQTQKRTRAAPRSGKP